MSLISMVLLLSPSCSDLLVIKVLNLEQGEKVGHKRGPDPLLCRQHRHLSSFWERGHYK